LSEGGNGGVGPARWTAGDGEMVWRIRERDWTATPLCPIEGCP
jgi:hypothetical protein